MKVLKAPLALILSLAMILSMGTTFALAGPLGETREDAPITVDAVGFSSVTVGTAVGATSIVIKNSSNSAVGISAVGVSSVDLATISEEFTIATEGTEEVPANGEITDWEIQPVDDLPVGEYAGTIFVIMDDDTVATADVTFEVLVKDESGVDKSALEAIIDVAEGIELVATSVDGSDIDQSENWVTTVEQSDFTLAIAAAQRVAGNADATQDEVSAAIEDLEAAITAYADAQKPGTKTDKPVVDKAELNKAITEATAAKNAVVPSADGTDVATDKTWATADNIAAFATAIAAAEAVNANPNATQEDVEDAVVTLNDAQAAFAEQTASGTKTDKPVEASKAALKMEITLANNAAKGVEISVDGSDISKDAKWVTKAVAETFAKAIAAAQAVVDDTKVDQAAVDTATKTLNTAKGVFVDAQKPGTKPGEPVTADKTVLNTSIEAATEAKVNVAVSVNGSDVAKDKKWVTKAVAETFDTAIAAAEKVAKDTKATQATVDNAVKALNTAKGVYVAAQKNGTYTASSGGSDGGSGSGSSGGSTNTANDPATTDKVKDTIDIIKDLPGTLDPAKLPAGVTVDKTAGGSSIATIPVTMTTGNANLNTDTLDTLGAGSSKVGLKITVTDNSSKGKESVEIIIPGGFGKINEPGRLAFPMDYKPEADDNAKMLAAVKTANATSTTAQIGGNFNLPVAATITVKSAAPEGATVHIYKYDPATGKMISIGSAKVVDGKLTFATKMMGQMLFTTGTV